MVLTKEEFISAVEAKGKPNDFKTHAAAVRAVDAVFDVIRDTLQEGGSVRVYGFGIFSTKEVAETTRKNMLTGEPYVVPKHLRVAFKSSSKLKDLINS